jgi:hypothetical protein
LPGLAEVRFIRKDSEELGDVKNDICGRGCFGVDIDVGVEELKYLEDEVAQLKCVILIKIDQGNFRLEGGFVEEKDDLLNVFGRYASLLDHGHWLVLHLNVLNFQKITI